MRTSAAVVSRNPSQNSSMFNASDTAAAPIRTPHVDQARQVGHPAGDGGQAGGHQNAETDHAERGEAAQL